MPTTTKVHSGLPSAVELRLHDLTMGEHGAFSINPGDVVTAKRRRNALPVTIYPGLNYVDVAFWREWAKQNEGSPLLSGLLEITDD